MIQNVAQNVHSSKMCSSTHWLAYSLSATTRVSPANPWFACLACRRLDPFFENRNAHQSLGKIALCADLVRHLFGLQQFRFGESKAVHQNVATLIVIETELMKRPSVATSKSGGFVYFHSDRWILHIGPVQLDGWAVADGRVVADALIVGANVNGRELDMVGTRGPHLTGRKW